MFQGRDNGAMYWGQFGKVKLSGGVFDGESATGDDTVISAGRVQVDFWDRDSRRMRGSGPFLFTQVTNNVGVTDIADAVLSGWKAQRQAAPNRSAARD